MTALLVQGLVQGLGSLAAVLLLWLACARLNPGGDPRIRDAETARRLADEAVDGFSAVDIGLDRAGIGALLRDGEGRVMLLRRHGVHYAARLLDGRALVRLDRHFLIITPADRGFGTITLNLGPQAQVWAGSFRRLGSA